MRAAVRAAVLLSLASLGACATVMDGHTQMVSVQTLKSDMISVDGTCVVSNKQGSWTVNTPGNVTRRTTPLGSTSTHQAETSSRVP